jgi:hypothetical protein
MKKILLASALAATSLLSFAQTPAVPNGGFENWTTSCGEKPSQYITQADYMNNALGSCPTASGVSKSTDKYSGTYALRLAGMNYMGILMPNSIVLSPSVSELGVDFNGRPTKLVGYTKFTKAGSDVLTIGVEVDDANGNELAYNDLTISTTQAGYTRFEIALTYDQSNTSPAATLIIGVDLGDANDDISANTVALIDALSFEYTPTSTISYAAKSPINVFAANNAINFSENVSDVHVVDMIGASKMQEAASTKTLNTASLTSGLYIVTYNYNGNYFSKKVVIE